MGLKVLVFLKADELAALLEHVFERDELVVECTTLDNVAVKLNGKSI